MKKRRSRRRAPGLALVGALALGCGGGSAAPPESAATPVAPPAAPAGREVPRGGSSGERVAAKGRNGAPAGGAEGGVLAPAAPTRAFGKVIDVEQWLEPWSSPATRKPVTPKPQRYDRWRQQKRIAVGFSHLSTAELSDDDRRLLAVSENEARLRVYEARSGKLLGNSKVAGYAQYGRGAFMWQPGSLLEPEVLFAHDGGIEAVDALTGVPTRRLAEGSAWQLRSSDDGAVLIANLPDIDQQTSKLVLYAWRPDGVALVTTMALRFSERVDGFDLSPDKRQLVVSHYPSDTVELLDLQSRRLVWSQPAPRYVSSVDISPDAALVAAGGDAVVVYDARDPSRQSRFTDLGNNVHQVRFSPSGDALAASAYDGRARILGPAADGTPLKLLKVLEHDGTANVYAVSFSSTGDRMVTSSGDKTLRIWGE